MSDTTDVPTRADPIPLQERIIEEHPRLGPDDTFRFGCHPGVSCFNHCCSDVNIFLSPYDVLRMRRRLGMGSTEFLEKYALLPVHKDMQTPVVLLRMNDDEEKNCPFVEAGGCSIYEDRPWPCRMYPVGLAASRDTEDGWRGERFYYLLQEEGCRGFEESESWTIREWMDNQGVDEFDRWGEAYKELTLHEFFENGGQLSPERQQMFYTAMYDLDKFRTFVFESSLLDKFYVDEDQIEEMRYSDEALLRFGHHWLRFALFREATMQMREEAMEAAQERLEKRVIENRRAEKAAQGEAR
jgi:Fe-S-cluster containining protein